MVNPNPYATYAVRGSVTLGIWAKKAGVWTRMSTAVINLYQEYSTGGSRTLTWNYNGSFDLGTGVDAVGITVESTTGSSAVVSDFTSLTWTSQTSSSTRSATPNGESSVVTIRPQ